MSTNTPLFEKNYQTANGELAETVVICILGGQQARKRGLQYRCNRVINTRDSKPNLRDSYFVKEARTEHHVPVDAERVMRMTAAIEITGLLIAWRGGDEAALEKLLPLVEKELRRLAHYYMRRLKPGNTFQTTALINETYIKLVNQKSVDWKNRAHFYGIAANMMRRILLNYIRDQKRQKRGGANIRVSLSETLVVSNEKTNELLALDDALTRLAHIDERKGRVVELRYFGGMSVAETAEVLRVSEITVIRDWKMAKAWLAREIGNAG